MPLTQPSVADFKIQFGRDFPFAPVEGTDASPTPGTNPSKVMDSDITAALLAAAANFNIALFGDQPTYTYCFCLLAAHYLCSNLLASAQGIRGQGEWLMQAKTVGDISAQYMIPDRINQHPYLGLLTKTRYGCQYLELMLPRAVGNIITCFGPTKP
jgi:hypothetical protein